MTIDININSKIEEKYFISSSEHRSLLMNIGVIEKLKTKNNNRKKQKTKNKNRKNPIKILIYLLEEK